MIFLHNSVNNRKKFYNSHPWKKGLWSKFLYKFNCIVLTFFDFYTFFRNKNDKQILYDFFNQVFSGNGNIILQIFNDLFSQVFSEKETYFYLFCKIYGRSDEQKD